MKFHPDRRTTYIGDFQSLGELQDWLLFHGVYHPQHELAKMWRLFIEQGRNYKIWIKGCKHHKPTVLFARFYPRCSVCGERLPKETTPTT